MSPKSVGFALGQKARFGHWPLPRRPGQTTMEIEPEPQFDANLQSLLWIGVEKGPR